MEDDQQLACRLAEAAGDVLLKVRQSNLFEGRPLGAAGDQLSQTLLARALATWRPNDAVLSEEASDSDARLGAARVWIIDPLDGTREYGEGRHDWAVHVALVTEGVLGAAAVALPGLGAVLGTAHAVRNGSDAVPERIRMAVSRTRPPAVAQSVARQLQAELVPLGSAGYKAMAVLRGEADVYLHSGGQYEWDSAAPVGVAQAAGLHASRIDGSALTYNQADPLLPDLLICRPELADQVLEAISNYEA